MLENLRGLFEKHNIHRVKLGAVDIDCTLRGKYVSLDKFWSAAEAGTGFCDVIFGWDIGDALYDDATVTGWHTGFPDAAARIALDTFRLIPWEPGTAFFLLDFVNAAAAVAPRQVLQRAIGKAGSYKAFFSAEYEFFFFRETPHSLREKNYRHLTPLSPGAFGYSILRASEHSELALALFDQLAGFGIALEGFHTETGPGVYEAAIAVDEALAAADKAALFKTAVKEVAARFGVIPTFMAKWNPDLPGSSGHLHQSLWDSGGEKNLFSDGAGGMSPLMERYIAGMLAHLPDLTAIFCPTINSYKRTVPGAWAPVNATWGVDNRTTAIRAIPGGSKSTRAELRLTGADINPYLSIAASLAAGVDGVERELVLPAATLNAYSGEAPALPRTLSTATARFRQSELARRWLGDEFVEHYAGTRDWEARQYEKAVTDWELARYFESI